MALARTNDLASTLKTISNVLDRVEDFHLEPEEFAYLKLCCLYSPDQSSDDLRIVTEPVVDCVLAAFNRFYQKSHSDKDRLAKLLLLLSPIRSIQADLVEELFFPGMVETVKIDSVIPYVLAMGDGATHEENEESTDAALGKYS